jgi:hypothetical protein
MILNKINININEMFLSTMIGTRDVDVVSSSVFHFEAGWKD